MRTPPNTRPAIDDAREHLGGPVTVGAGLRSALAAAGVFFFFTGIDDYALAFWSAPAPIYFIWLFVGAAGLLVVLNPRVPIHIVRSPLLLWALAFFVMTTAWAVETIYTPVVFRVLRDRYRSVGFLVAFAILFDDPRARRIGALAVVAAVILASCLNIAEMFGGLEFPQLDDDRVAGRSAGVYVNPNISGSAIVFGLAVAIDRVPRSLRVPLLMVSTAGVATTFSRGAAICLVALIILLIWRKQVGFWPVALVCSVIALFVTTQPDMLTRFLDGVLTTDTAARVHFAQDDSGRVGMVRAAWQLFLDSPLAGHGVGATSEAHNQFLTYAGDYGVLGLIALPALGLALVASNPSALPFATVLMLAGFFSHNLLDDRSTLVALALVATGETPGLGAPDRMPPTRVLEDGPRARASADESMAR